MMLSICGGKSILDFCFASPEEIPERQEIYVAPLETAGIITVEMIPYCGPMLHGTQGCLTWMRWGPRSGGSALLVDGLSVLVSILLRSLNMSGAALSTQLMMALSLWGSCS